MSDKTEALRFLETMHERLNGTFPSWEPMRAEIEELERKGKSDSAYKYLCSPEHAFTRGIALQAIFKELVTTFGMTPNHAREALLAEGWKKMPEISSNTPARSVRHPFDKALITDCSEVYKKWSRETNRLPLTQSCPDFALRNPCPHKILFEAKYFVKGSLRKAEKELVADLYQAFFYRALPKDESNSQRPWDYDYACLFAYDASEEGIFKQAWEQLDTEVRHGFWEGANVYVMILRGTKP